jgi:hypothetical protein
LCFVQALAQVLPCAETICIVELNNNLSYWQHREKKESKERNISRSFVAQSQTIFEDFDKEIQEDGMAEAVQQNKEVQEESEKDEESGQSEGGVKPRGETKG